MKKNIVEEYFKILKQLITILHIEFPCDEKIKKCKNNVEKINSKKHIHYFYKKINNIQEKIYKGDITIFDSKLILVPDLNLSEYYKLISSDDTKETVLIYLQSMQIYTRKAKKIDDSLADLEKETVLNIKKFLEKENKKTSTLNEINSTVKDAFSGNQNNIMLSMISEINTELENNKDALPNEQVMMNALMTGKMDQLGPIFNIANNIALKMKSKVESNEINKDDLLNSAQSLVCDINKNPNSNIPMNNIINEIHKINEGINNEEIVKE